MRKAIFVRHVQAEKGERQELTDLGEFIALTMGLVFAKTYQGPYVSTISSPQIRAVNTARRFLDAQHPKCYASRMPTVVTDARLNDFSTDTRPEISVPLQAAINMAKAFGIAVEAAMYAVSGGLNAIRLKASEAMQLVDEVIKSDGCHFFAMHGGTIDQIHWEMVRTINAGTEIVEAPGYKGGILANGEGFIVDFDDDCRPVRVETIRHPAWLKAAIATFPPPECPK